MGRIVTDMVAVRCNGGGSQRREDHEKGRDEELANFHLEPNHEIDDAGEDDGTSHLNGCIM
jgi:hypothetical protein